MLSNRSDLQAYTKLLTQSQGWIAGQIEVTSACSQRCRYCSSWREDVKAPSEWSLEQFTEFCWELVSTFPNFEHLTLTGGEPQNWPWLERFLLESWPDGLMNHVALQISTTLCEPVATVDLWRRFVRDVRVSLDAVNPRIYEKVRGVKQDPEKILDNMEALNHPRLAVIVTLYPENIDHFPSIYKRLYNYIKHGSGSIRRIIVMPGMGLAKSKQDAVFLEKWYKLVAIYGNRCLSKSEIPTSFAEDPFVVRAQPNLRDVPCYVGASTFHIKSNGDVYPCCLFGGEAVGTSPGDRIGNVWQETPLEVWHRNKIPKMTYANPTGYCMNNCFWKQLAMNVESHKASEYCLSMP